MGRLISAYSFDMTDDDDDDSRRASGVIRHTKEKRAAISHAPADSSSW